MPQTRSAVPRRRPTQDKRWARVTFFTGQTLAQYMAEQAAFWEQVRTRRESR